MTMLQHGAVPSTGGYRIERSLRFNSADSAYLNRTPGSAGNRKTWTWSGWVKRSSLVRTADLMLFACRPAGYTNFSLRNANSSAPDSFLFEDNNGATLITTAKYRDPSAWYHIVLAVDTTQATASNRIKLYVNGSQVTAFSTETYPSQNLDMQINSANAHGVGGYSFNTSEVFDGYMADVHFIDGSALTPSSFGENDTDTGVWKPKAYTGSYGTNGFKLTFSDNSGTTATTLGKDTSGNGNNWTPNNFSVTAGAGNDSLVDTPTPYGSDTGVGGEVRGNYCTVNPIANPSTPTYSITNGNLDYAATGSSGVAYQQAAIATIGVTTGKWYFEGTVTSNNPGLGFSSMLTYQAARGTIYITYFSGSLAKSSGISSSGTPATFTNGDVIGVAYDAGAGTATVYKNNVSQGTFSSIPTGTPLFPYVEPNTAAASSGVSFNFGQRPFAYTAPSGYKALCTTNLPTPAIGATSTTRADKYFNPTTYTGNGSSSRAITNGIDMSTNGGLVWTKQRSGVEWHFLIDSVRGNTKYLSSNAVNAEGTISTLVTSFDSTGYSIGNDSGINSNGATYVGWSWGAGGTGVSNTQGTITSTVSANTTSGFSIVTYTGTGSNATVGHGLGVAPSMFVVKRRNSSGDWVVWQKNVADAGSGLVLFLNATDGQTSAATNFNSTAPTSTVFSVGTNSATNGSGGTYVAYCFAEVAGYSRFGSYTGNGSADGTFVYVGFRPRFIMLKNTTTAGNAWHMIDTVRGTYNVYGPSLDANASSAEITYTICDVLSNGFKFRDTNQAWNKSGDTYIYMALAENPFKYSLAR